MTFRSSSLFIPEEAPPQDVVLKQWVVTAVVNGRNVSNLTTPVEINIQNIQVMVIIESSSQLKHIYKRNTEICMVNYF